MCHDERHRQAAYQVWRKSYEACQRRSRRCQNEITPAIELLLDELQRYQSEEALLAFYWEPGDWPGALLLEQLSNHPGSDLLLEIEEAAFWLRLRELARDVGPVAPQP